MKKIVLSLFAAICMVFMANGVWADGTLYQSLTFEVDNPPAIELVIADCTVDGELALTGDDYLSTGITEAVWEVHSNNAFDFKFEDAGSSYKDTFAEGVYGYPVFTKLDVDASGDQYTDRWDHLTTEWAVDIIDEDSVSGSGGATWGSTSNPAESGAHLVGGFEVADSPNAADAIGRVMPDDDDNQSTVKLYSEATSTTDAQSGDYSCTVKMTVRMDEQGDD